MATSCEACGGPVNEAVVKCPHCGEKRASTAPAYTKAEIRAIIANEEALIAHQSSSTLFKALVLPHKHTRGLLRLVELALTAVTLPAVAAGAIGIWFLGARRSKGAFSTSGEIAPVVVMTLLGGGAIWGWLGGQYAMMAVTAMWARAGLRMIAAGQAERALIDEDKRDAHRAASDPLIANKRERELIDEDAKRPSALAPSRVAVAPPRPSAPALPTARVVSTAEPVKPSVPAIAVKTPEPVTPTDPNGEPSILR
ncbi:MAG TPA: hypothetical protein VMZ53_13565 [Kofleriaceae bacterium]|nr:hypothetical protein [Kofleriaceae bacterium]